MKAYTARISQANKSELTAVLKQMGKLSAEERPVIGQLANDVRAKLEANIEEKTKELADKAMELKLKSEAVDVTIPGKQEKIGVKHPMYQVLDEIKDIFVGWNILLWRYVKPVVARRQASRQHGYYQYIYVFHNYCVLDCN